MSFLDKVKTFVFGNQEKDLEYLKACNTELIRLEPTKQDTFNKIEKRLQTKRTIFGVLKSVLIFVFVYIGPEKILSFINFIGGI